jgi:glucose-6-phosphate dehydrogenase assembly protein OpcA
MEETVTPPTIAPDRILHELAGLWVSLGKQGGDSGAGVLRACSMTLIVLTEEADDVMTLGETIAALMPEHPARVVVVRMSGAGERPLAARVFAQCWMPFGQRRQICCEQVEITAADASLAELPAVVLPLCVPDLPSILWCRSARLAALPDFPPLAAIARKLIVDSAPLPDPGEALSRLAATVSSGSLLADLSWTRLTRPRETIARVFDNREYQGRISELSRIDIHCGGTTPPSSAWYMAAWLAGALEPAGQTVHPALHCDPAAPAGEIRRVELGGSVPGALTVALAVKGDGMTVCIDGISNCAMLPRATEYLLLREELGIVRRDAMYEKTLSAAALLAVSSGKAS